ncbi:hypothetical protein EDD36DRAFT_55473 [Exophiala viscosa]|uniref:Uncharacterized protein n=1 Tax=Exophiala viscosa TaxID=2486360 RepID=A0AAN6DR16_9EURO|nr:hypothetical protein EDD36DRAFT_55473 [Exophiala viscosa]
MTLREFAECLLVLGGIALLLTIRLIALRCFWTEEARQPHRDEYRFYTDLGHCSEMKRQKLDEPRLKEMTTNELGSSASGITREFNRNLAVNTQELAATLENLKQTLENLQQSVENLAVYQSHYGMLDRINPVESVASIRIGTLKRWIGR